MLKARRIIRALVGCSLLAGALVSAQPAKAAMCPFESSTSHNCWQDYSGPNFGQVAVFKGVACAVTVSSIDNFGGSVYCFQPTGSSAAFFNIFAGAAVQSADFNETDKRIISIALGQQSGVISRELWVLRVDGQLFNGVLPDPLPPIGSGAAIVMSPIGTPSPIRAITFVQPGNFLIASKDLYAVDTSNRLLRLKLSGGDTWGVVPEQRNMVYYAGTDIRQSPPCCGDTAPAPTFGVALYGTSGFSRELDHNQICGFPDVPSNVTLARSAANPSQAFFDLGRTRPVSVGKDDAWLVTNSLTMTGRILRSTRGSGSCYSAWSTYAVPDLGDQFDSLWSIADGRDFRNVRGELLAIGRSYHLINYIP